MTAEVRAHGDDAAAFKVFQAIERAPKASCEERAGSKRGSTHEYSSPPPKVLINEGVDRAVSGHIKAAIGPQNGLERLDRSAAAGDSSHRLSVGPAEPIKLAVALSANHPDDWIRVIVGGGHDRCATAIEGGAPGGCDRPRRNTEHHEIARLTARTGRALALGYEGDLRGFRTGVSPHRADDPAVRHLSHGNLVADPSEILAIEQIGVAILAQCEHPGGDWGVDRNR